MYPGNKAIPGVIHKIINQIPDCYNFYELFAGSAAVSQYLSVLARAHTVKYFINDVDPAVTVKFNYPAGSLVTNFEALDIIKSLLTVPAVSAWNFIFLDPPYLHNTRSNSELYKYEMTVLDHEQLLSTVRDLKHNCMIIHPACDLYNHVLKSFRKVHLYIRYHSKTSHEVLYMNYPEPQTLLTYDLYGSDCWDRERIKRKGDRLIKKISGLPVLEQKYIVSRLCDLGK